MTNFTNIHRYFVQFMLNNGTVTESEALTFFSEINPEESSLTHLKTLIIEINREICNQSYKITSTTCEISGDNVFIWLNSKNDDISRLQVAFSKIALEYFHAVMKEIVSSEEHTIPYPRAINISSTLTATFSRENGEKNLMTWISGGYFVKNQGNIYLGPRTILEFTSFLRANTENCICELCSELVFVGDSCSSCFKKFHFNCIKKYLMNQTTCPKCKDHWESGNMDEDET